MSTKSILATTFTCVTLLVIIILTSLDLFIGKTIIIIVACGVGLFATLGVASIVGKKEMQERQYIVFDKESKSATLLQRNAISSASFYIQPIDKVHYDFKPSELVYTGATVGGVTTGGFHTTEAHYREKSDGASGKALLLAKLRNGETVTIKKIHLSDEKLKEAAANDPRIKRFLKGNALVLEYSGKETELTKDESFLLKKAISTNNKAMQNYVTQRAFLAMQLTKEDCENIKNWVAGN